MFTVGSMESPVTKAFLSSALGTFGSSHVMQVLSDRDPNHISEKAQKNYFKFFPAGTSFKTIEHFRQLLLTDRFARF